MKIEEIEKEVNQKVKILESVNVDTLHYEEDEYTHLLEEIFSTYLPSLSPRSVERFEKLLGTLSPQELEKKEEEAAKRIIYRTVKSHREGFLRGDKHPSVQDNFVLTDAVKFSINKNIASQIKTYQEAIIWKSIAVKVVEKYENELEQRWRTLKEQLKEKFQYDEYSTCAVCGNGRYAIVKEKMRKFLYLYEYLSKGRGIARVWFFRDNRERIEFKKDVSKGVSDTMTKINNEIIKKLEEVKE